MISPKPVVVDTPPSSGGILPVPTTIQYETPKVDSSFIESTPDSPASSPSAPPEPKKSTINRCVKCRKRVGLTGFECRCGGLYCGVHRYSDKHECTFNYREMGAEEIRKNNPVVMSEKVQKI